MILASQFIDEHKGDLHLSRYALYRLASLCFLLAAIILSIVAYHSHDFTNGMIAFIFFSTAITFFSISKEDNKNN